jgi:hypothetical protein
MTLVREEHACLGPHAVEGLVLTAGWVSVELEMNLITRRGRVATERGTEAQSDLGLTYNMYSAFKPLSLDHALPPDQNAVACATS